MTVENISWSISTKECCRPWRGSNPQPPGLQSDAHPTEPPRLATFALQVTSELLMKFAVNCPFGSKEKKSKKDFQQPLLGWLSWISNLKDFSYFWFTSHSNTSYQVLSQLAFRFRRIRAKIDFKVAAMVAILDFRLEWIKLFLIYKLPGYFLPSFESTGRSDFQDGGHLELPMGRIYKSPRCCLPSAK